MGLQTSEVGCESVVVHGSKDYVSVLIIPIEKWHHDNDSGYLLGTYSQTAGRRDCRC